MSLPKQSSIWDERRNSSAVIPPPPGALEAAIKACRQHARRFPEHVRWLLDGHPNLTEQEHYERFGRPYKKGEL